MIDQSKKIIKDEKILIKINKLLDEKENGNLEISYRFYDFRDELLDLDCCIKKSCMIELNDSKNQLHFTYYIPGKNYPDYVDFIGYEILNYDNQNDYSIAKDNIISMFSSEKNDDYELGN